MRAVDEIVVIEDGKVVERGPYKDLIEDKDSKFSILVKNQFM